LATEEKHSLSRGSIVLQVSTFIHKYQLFTAPIKLFAIKQGLLYHQIKLLKSHPVECVYTRKVLAIEKALLSLPSGAWVWYFDTDAAFTGVVKKSDILSIFLEQTSASRHACSFIAQDADEQINTGCFLIRNSLAGRVMMALWRDKQLRHKPCRTLTSADQVTLQDVVLEVLIPMYDQADESCLNFCGALGCLNDCIVPGCTPPPDAPWDWMKGWPNIELSNVCYGEWMASHMLPFNHRINRSICLLPEQVRFNVHDLDNKKGIWYMEGDVFSSPTASIVGRIRPARPFCKI